MAENILSSGLEKFNTTCITQVAATILNLLGVEKNAEMAAPIPEVLDVAGGFSSCDRVFMYNPDAISQWIFNKYKKFSEAAKSESSLALEMLSVVPPVTPVCFASMYSGLKPEKHGIQSYVKPILKCQTIFDKLPESNKKLAIVSTKGDSISLIFLNRKVDYFIYKSVKECNEKAKQLIKEDKYDVIILYNKNYDYWMHRSSPEGFVALSALKHNFKTYLELNDLLKKEWAGKHKTALAFAPDHGCHRFFGVLGTHGIEKPCDMNIVHLWNLI